VDRLPRGLGKSSARIPSQPFDVRDEILSSRKYRDSHGLPSDDRTGDI
jgi:hypothetical protein